MSDPKSENKEIVAAALVHLEYYLDHYLSDNFDQKISDVLKDVAQRKEEAIKVADKATVGMPSRNSIGNFTVMIGNKDLEITNQEIINRCNEKLFSDDSIRHDLLSLAAKYNSVLLAQFGPDKLRELDKSSEFKSWASSYIYDRCREQVINKLVEKEMPRSSAEYIAQKIFRESSISLLAGAINPSMQADVVSSTAEDKYNPNLLEKGIGWLGAVAVDTALFKRIGGSITVFGVDITRGAFNGLTGDAEALNVSNISETYFNDKKILEKCRIASKDADNISNKLLLQIDKDMQHPIAHGDTKLSIQTTEQLVKAFGNDGVKTFETVEQILQEANIKIEKNNSLTKEMPLYSEERCCTLSAYYLSLAEEMRINGVQRRLINDKSLVTQQVYQLAYDYARAARLQTLSNHKEEKKEDTKKEDKTKMNESSYDKKVAHTTSSSSQSGTITHSVQSVQYPQTAVQTPSVLPQEGFSGWQSLLDNLGLGNLGKNSKNMGYMISVLPDMIVNMFTGRSKNFKFSDNIFPLSLILASIFIKNKAFRYLLLAFGAAKLLNNATQTTLDRPSRTTLQARRYDNEILDSRLKYVSIKGNTMHAEIDGVPYIVRINDEVMNAYTQGRLPLNTLANAVLRQYDEQTTSLSRNYDEVISASEKQEHTIAVK